MVKVLKCHNSFHMYISVVDFSLAYDAPKVWNELPDDIDSAMPRLSFRRKLKAYIFAKSLPTRGLLGSSNCPCDVDTTF